MIILQGKGKRVKKLKPGDEVKQYSKQRAALEAKKNNNKKKAFKV